VGYFYVDPSGLGSWYVPDGSTPAQAIATIQATTSTVIDPSLQFSIDHTPAAQQINGLKPSLPPVQLVPNSVPATHPPVIVRGIPRVQVVPKDEEENPPGEEVPPGGVGGGGDTLSSCPDGYFYDAYNDVCVPNETGTGGVGTGTQASGEAAAVTVTVNNAVVLSKSAIDSITNVVQDAITQGISKAQDAAQTAAEAVTNAVGDLASGIKSGVDALLQGLKDGLVYIANLVVNNIGALVTFIRDNIGTIMSDIKDVVTNVVVPVLKSVQDVITKVNDVLTNTIAPIFNTISQVTKNIEGLITAIQKDVSNGIQGLLQLPGDIAGSLTGVEASLERLGQQLSGPQEGSLPNTIGGTSKDTVWHRLKSLGDAITQPQIPGGGDTTFEKRIEFTSSNARQLMHDLLIQADAQGKETFNAFGEILSEVIADVRQGFSGAPDIIERLIEGPIWIILLVLSYGVEIEPIISWARQVARTRFPLEKLDVDDTIQAWLRGFITPTQRDEELLTKGLDSDRIATLVALVHYLPDIGSGIEWFHRHLISEPDLRNNFKDHGLDENQQNAMINASYKLVDVHQALTAYLYKNLNDAQLSDVLVQNRFTAEEIAIFRSVIFSPETTTSAIERHRRDQLYKYNLMSDDYISEIPTDVLDAGRAEGLSVEQVTSQWRNQIEKPSVREGIDLYFRQIRTRPELDAIFDSWRIDPYMRDDMIEANRPLLPWRTIPAMVANGIIDPPYAKSQLQAHGFDLTATEALLKYAGLTKPKPSATGSGDLHALSIANAKSFWEQGVISPEEYHDILVAHGYDKNTADLAVKAQSLQNSARERRAAGEDLINEVLSGTITIDQAQTSMTGLNFSTAERAKVLRQIAKTKAQTAKTPTEQELVKFVQSGIIGIQDYRDAMSVLGFAAKWIDAFVALHFGGASGKTA